MRKSIIKRVVNEVVNMYLNDIIEDNGTESFEGWCENGDVFYNDDSLDVQDKMDCISLMENIAPTVDKLTAKLEEN